MYSTDQFDNLAYLDKYHSKKILAKIENSVYLFDILEKYKYLYDVRIKQKVSKIKNKRFIYFDSK